mmetsp:Transcript_4449/g.6583  ORF Transcript_4449/g.6583 Transcript_4449/m.6583 type:complete len:261 (-) Transcript_4449:111-893(-)
MRNSHRVSGDRSHVKSALAALRSLEGTVEHQVDVVVAHERSGGHGQVQEGVVSEHGGGEGVGAFVGDHGVDLLHFGVNELANLLQLVLDDVVDQPRVDLHEEVQDLALHVDLDVLDSDSGLIRKSPVDTIGRFRLKDEIKGKISDIDMRGLEGNETQSINLTVDVHINVDSTDAHVDVIVVDLLEDLRSESADGVHVDLLHLQLPEEVLVVDVRVESLVVESVIAHNRDERADQVLDRSSVERHLESSRRSSNSMRVKDE